MLKIAIIGIGNAGNQVANVAVTKGIPAICINSSVKDLDTISESISVVLIGHSEGAGKDRSVAKRFLKQDFKKIIMAQEFNTFLEPVDIVFIVSSSGGGTGSGVSIMFNDILSHVYENKVFINIGILPTLVDSVGAQRNTLEYLKELNATGKPYLLYDNQKFKDLDTASYMKKVNEAIVSDILYIRGDYSYKTQYGMIDDADMLKILTVPGMINVSKFENFLEKDIQDNTHLDQFIIRDMKVNATCPLDRDRIIKRMGIIANLTPNLSQYYDTGFTEFKKSVGEPIEIFEHYFVNETNDTKQFPNRFAFILSGLSIPDDRIQIIMQRIEEVEEMIKKKKENSLIESVESLDSLKVDSMLVDRTKSSERNDVENMDFEFLDKY